jgi:hypothetical protein
MSEACVSDAGFFLQSSRKPRFGKLNRAVGR